MWRILAGTRHNLVGKVEAAMMSNCVVVLFLLEIKKDNIVLFILYVSMEIHEW